MNSGTRLEHFLLFFLSLVAGVWFFAQYPSQDPRSAIDIRYNKKEIKQKALQQWTNLGYAANKYKAGQISLITREHLLDSLQYHLGRPEATRMLADSIEPNLKPFVWEIIFESKDKPGKPVAAQANQEPPGSGDDQNVHLQIDDYGQLVALINTAEQLPQITVNRAALKAIISPDDSTHKTLMPDVSDSILTRMLYFDMQRKGPYANTPPIQAREVRTRFSNGVPYLESKKDAQALADYYIKKTGWEGSQLVRDSVFIKRINTINAANVRYTAAKPIQGQQLQLDVVVAPTGALLGLQPAYNATASTENSSNYIWDAIIVILIFMLGLSALITFFSRMRARTIDTHSALVVAVIMGLILPAYIFLATISRQNIFGSSDSWNQVLNLFIGMGFVGALASVAFFVLFAVSDSLTRQYWSSKLSSYDYILQGQVFNKPVGTVLLRSVGLAFILSGIWTLLLQLLPGLYLELSNSFLNEYTAWAPLYLLLHNTWFSFGILLILFLMVGSQTYGRSGKPWLAACIIIFGCGILVPVLVDLGPNLHEFLVGALLGAILTFIYMKWDFLTLLLSHFLFISILGSVTGWIMHQSPDIYVFYCVIGLLLVVLMMGSYAVFFGKNERLLSEYVPGYVEELAQEQRIKQELQIARDVQQSFLPTQTPAIPGLDIAAICQPAYETGGDYYDFIPLDDHRVAVAIGDVSGKGIQAAFYMTLVKGILHSLCREIDSPAEVLRKANRLFFDNAAKGTFISLIYGVIDMQRQTFTFARAGHNPILHTRIATAEVEELQPEGLGIGLTKNKIFDNNIREIKLSITDDDLFLLYTDGIVEALNGEHQFYGTDKLTALIKKQKRKSAEAIVSAISKKVTRFIGKTKQHDDMTLLAIRFNKKE